MNLINMYKEVAGCLLVLVSVCAENHFIDDCLNPGDDPVVIYDQEVSKLGSFLHYQEQTIRIPASGFSAKPISCISVTNLESDKVGGYPKIESGGVGYKYVTIFLKSQLSKGFDFRVSVYYNKLKTFRN